MTVPPVAASARSLLPPEAYWSPEWYAAEQDRLFAHCWNLVGTVHDLAGGARIAATVAGATVFVSCDEDGALRADGLDRPVAADAWAGYVFVNLDLSAPSLNDWLGSFPDRIGDFHPEQLVEVARHRFVLHANWKLFVENHIDVYHLWYLHADSLAAYDHPRAEWSMVGPHWVFYEPPRDGVDTHAASFWRGLRPVTTEDRWGSGAHLVFPNLTLATGAGFFMTYQCVPVGPDRSLVDIRIRAERGADCAEMLGMSQTVIEFEDGAACEAMQAAVMSPAFSVGPLAREHELPITHFHEQVLAAVGR